MSKPKVDPPVCRCGDPKADHNADGCFAGSYRDSPDGRYWSNCDCTKYRAQRKTKKERTR